jgi:glycosyltransferase involved in cell wall biosynthesis
VKSAAPLRVLHLGKHYPPFMGGIETHLRTLAEGLSDSAEIEVVVASSNGVASEEQIGPVRVKRVKQTFTVQGAPVCAGFVREIRAADTDLIHLHLPNPAAVLAVLASGYSGPLIATYHSDVVRQRVLGQMFEPVRRGFLGRCPAIIVTSHEYAASSPTLAAFAKECHVIPYGIRSEPFAIVDQHRIAQIRNRYGDRIVLGVGRLIYYKGFEFLLDAMKDLDANLLLIGEGPLKDSLRAQTAALGIQDRVTFLGEVQNEDTAAYYHAARMLVLPSIARSEAFGIVQLEAMAAGCPVINTNLDSGVPSVSVDGVTGLTVPPRDSAALASAAGELLADKDRASAFGAAGQARVAEYFSAARMCDDTLELYSRVVARNSPRADKTLPVPRPTRRYIRVGDADC